MGFVVLIAVGGILGWLASILSRSDEPRAIALDVALGVVGALVAGLLATTQSLIVGLSAMTLVSAIGGAVVLLAAFHAIRRNRLRNDTF